MARRAGDHGAFNRRLVKVDKICRRLSISRAMIYRLMKQERGSVSRADKNRQVIAMGLKRSRRPGAAAGGQSRETISVRVQRVWRAHFAYQRVFSMVSRMSGARLSDASIALRQAAPCSSASL